MLSRRILVEYLHEIESKTIDSVEILDYVNYYGLIRGDQIIVCTNRKGSTGLILMCKKTESLPSTAYRKKVLWTNGVKS